MNERVTFISLFDKNNLKKLEAYVNLIEEKLCKVPFGKNVDNREEADTLPYHFTLSAWNIKDKDTVIKGLETMEFPKIKILINNIGIMSGKENSYVLYFDIEDNKELKLLQKKVYNILQSEK